MIDVEVLWDFGSSDEMNILILKRDDLGNLQIKDVIKNCAHKLDYYIDCLKLHKDKFNYTINHLPKSAYVQSLSGGKSAYEVLKEKGFSVNDPKS